MALRNEKSRLAVGALPRLAHEGIRRVESVTVGAEKGHRSWGGGGTHRRGTEGRRAPLIGSSLGLEIGRDPFAFAIRAEDVLSTLMKNLRRNDELGAALGAMAGLPGKLLARREFVSRRAVEGYRHVPIVTHKMSGHNFFEGDFRRRFREREISPGGESS